MTDIVKRLRERAEQDAGGRGKMACEKLVAAEDEVDLSDKANWCEDFDDDCESIAQEGGCARCWAYMPELGICPYLIKDAK